MGKALQNQLIRFIVKPISLFVLPDLIVVKHIKNREMLILRDIHKLEKYSQAHSTVEKDCVWVG